MNPLVSIVITGAQFACVVWFYRSNRQLIDENRKLRWTALAATTFARALAERNVAIRCDDCGNLMYPTDEIVIIPRPDGEMYVGHSSHDRKSDWGLVE